MVFKAYLKLFTSIRQIVKNDGGKSAETDQALLSKLEATMLVTCTSTGLTDVNFRKPKCVLVFQQAIL